MSVSDQLFLTIWVFSQMSPPGGGLPGRACLKGLPQSLSITSPCFTSTLVLFLLEMIFFTRLLPDSPVRPSAPGERGSLSCFLVHLPVLHASNSAWHIVGTRKIAVEVKLK